MTAPQCAMRRVKKTRWIALIAHEISNLLTWLTETQTTATDEIIIIMKRQANSCRKPLKLCEANLFENNAVSTCDGTTQPNTPLNVSHGCFNFVYWRCSWNRLVFVAYCPHCVCVCGLRSIYNTQTHRHTRPKDLRRRRRTLPFPKFHFVHIEYSHRRYTFHFCVSFISTYICFGCRQYSTTKLGTLWHSGGMHSFIATAETMPNRTGG